MSPKQKERAKVADKIIALKKQAASLMSGVGIAAGVRQPQRQAAIDKLNENIRIMEQRYKDLGGDAGSVGGETQPKPKGDNAGLDKALEDAARAYM